MHAHGLRRGHVAREVVQKDGAGGVIHPDALQRGEEDGGVGLAYPFLARIDDGVEELVVEAPVVDPRRGVITQARR